MKSWIIALIIVQLTSSCHRIETNTSATKHELGKTRANFDPNRRLICQENAGYVPYKLADNPQLVQAYQTVNEYLRSLMEHIAERNASTFTGNLAISNFCITMETHLAAFDMLNAYASPLIGDIVFYPQMILSSKNDAELAVVLTHELAHITMQHDHNKSYNFITDLMNAKGAAAARTLEAHLNERDRLEERFRDHIVDFEGFLLDNQVDVDRFLLGLYLEQTPPPAAERDEQSLSDFFYRPGLCEAAVPANNGAVGVSPPQKNEAEDKDTDKGDSLPPIPAESICNHNQYADYVETFVALKVLYYNNHDSIIAYLKSINYDSNIFYNHQEEEADEVGFEFYLRAGFDPEHYKTSTSRLFFSDDPLISDERIRRSCYIRLKNNTTNNNSRGSYSHPYTCWRMHNILLTEMTEHSAAYEPLLENAHIANLDNSLSRIKTLINQIKRGLEEYEASQKRSKNTSDSSTQ